MWLVGSVLAELLLGQPLCLGKSIVDPLVERIKILGKLTREEIKSMNSNYTKFNSPHIKAYPWHKVLHKRKSTHCAMTGFEFFHSRSHE